MMNSEISISPCTCENKVDVSNLDTFFNYLSIPIVKHDPDRKLQQLVSIEKLTVAVKSLQSGWSPRADGCMVEFYEKVSPKIALILLDVYHKAFVKSTLPMTLTQVSILHILKKYKDPQNGDLASTLKSLTHQTGATLELNSSWKLDNKFTLDQCLPPKQHKVQFWDQLATKCFPLIHTSATHTCTITLSVVS